MRKIDKASQRFLALQEIANELINTKSQESLLRLIVNKATELLNCDAGSLYLKYSENSLAFKVAVNYSIPVNFQHILIPINGRGIACYVFREGKPLIINDVYSLPPNAPFRFDNSFDENTGYRTRSTLVQPLKSTKGEVLGVLQLINRKNSFEQKWPSKDFIKLEGMPFFDDEDEALLKGFASLASASIENANLYSNVEELLQGFIHASVRAIESRDPVTSGHSERVAALAIELAKAVSACQDEDVREIIFSANQFKELEYASLLHDFGKISVRETTLLKPKKLTNYKYLKIKNRIEHFAFSEELRMVHQALNIFQKEQRPPTDFDIARVNKKTREIHSKFNNCWRQISRLNQPTVLSENKSKELDLLRNRNYRKADGSWSELLKSDELSALSIPKGSLSESERLEIENHVTFTYLFLKEIPWTSEFRYLPEIVYAHHEKMDGTGYPRKLKGEQIPIQSRIMSICDIYDALVVADRPYKTAIPTDRALTILKEDSAHGKLDYRFVKIFVEQQIYDLPEIQRLTSFKKVA